jgi:hypothetical protein
MDTDAASDTDDDVETIPTLAPSAITATAPQSTALVEPDIAQDAEPTQDQSKPKQQSKHKKNQSNTSQDGKDVVAAAGDDMADTEAVPETADPETSPRSARRDKRRASLKTVLEMMKKDDVRAGPASSDPEGAPSPSTSAVATSLPASGTPTKEKASKKKNFVSQMFSGSPKVAKRDKLSVTPPRRGSVSTGGMPPEPLFGTSTYHGATNSTTPPKSEKPDSPAGKRRSHRKTHSDDTNLTSSDAETLTRASISRGTSGLFATRARSGSLGDTDDDRDDSPSSPKPSRLISTLSSSVSSLPLQEGRTGSLTSGKPPKRGRLVISSSGTTETELGVSAEVQSSESKRKEKRTSEFAPTGLRSKGSDRNIIDQSPAIVVTETFSTKRTSKRHEEDISTDPIELVSPGPVRRASKDFLSEIRERNSHGRIATQAKGSETTDETTRDDDETEEIGSSAQVSGGPSSTSIHFADLRFS